MVAVEAPRRQRREEGECSWYLTDERRRRRGWIGREQGGESLVRATELGFTVEERFRVQAPVERVWQYIVTPERVVTCLPGAELVERVDERTFLGNVKVKVGPVTLTYKGRVQFAELDQAAWRVRLVGEGREAQGSGAAKMTMESRILAHPEGGTEVVVHAQVDVAGRIVQLGRGMIPEISHQLFQQFAACVRETLEAPPAESGLPAAPTPAKPVRALPLLFRALWASIGRFFRRLFRRKR
jgi:carbon monoxide dehydrogenase subunit G